MTRWTLSTSGVLWQVRDDNGAWVSVDDALALEADLEEARAERDTARQEVAELKATIAMKENRP
jgi:hypothetical protein